MLNECTINIRSQRKHDLIILTKNREKHMTLEDFFSSKRFKKQYEENN